MVGQGQSVQGVSLGSVVLSGLSVEDVARVVVDLLSRGVPVFIDDVVYRDIGGVLEGRGFVVERVSGSGIVDGVVIESRGSRVETMSVGLWFIVVGSSCLGGL